MLNMSEWLGECPPLDREVVSSVSSRHTQDFMKFVLATLVLGTQHKAEELGLVASVSVFGDWCFYNVYESWA